MWRYLFQVHCTSIDIYIYIFVYDGNSFLEGLLGTIFSKRLIISTGIFKKYILLRRQIICVSTIIYVSIIQ